MKIALLSTLEQYEWGGTEEVWAQFATLALHQGHSVHVSVCSHVARSPRIQALQALGLEVSVRHPFRPTRAYLLKERFYSDFRLLETFDPDILVINSGSLFDPLNLPAIQKFCDRTTIPQVFFCHFVAEGFIPCYRDRLLTFAQNISGWVFVSQHNQTLAERQLAHHFNNAQVIINGPRLMPPAPLAWPQAPQKPSTFSTHSWSTNTTIHFGCVARLETQWKGQDILLDVLHQPQWRDRNWHLNLYGTGTDKLYIQQLIIHYQLEHRVTLHGYVNDVEVIWKKNHLMLLASRGEGTPLAILEAMACGRPTVSTDVGGNREILQHQITGWIADAATPHAISHTLETAWNERDRWLAMGNAAHHAAQQFAGGNAAQTFLNYLKQQVSNLKN